MDNFDFRKVHRVMKMLNWKWAHSDNGVPKEYELRNHAREDLNRVLSEVMNGHDEYEVSCGGFEAYARRWNRQEMQGEPCIQLTLKFVLTDWDADTSV